MYQKNLKAGLKSFRRLTLEHTHYGSIALPISME